MGIWACWTWGGTLDDAATGAVEAESCSGASENASVVDARDWVSAVAVALWRSDGAPDGAWEGKVGCDSCVGVAKASVETEDCVSVGISASWPWRAAVCSLSCSRLPLLS